MKKTFLLLVCAILSLNVYGQSIKTLLPDEIAKKTENFAKFDSIVTADSKIHPYVVFYYLKFIEHDDTSTITLGKTRLQYQKLHRNWKEEILNQKVDYLEAQREAAEEEYSSTHARATAGMLTLPPRGFKLREAPTKSLFDDNLASYIFYIFATDNFNEKYDAGIDYSKKLKEASVKFNNKVNQFVKNLDKYNRSQKYDFIDMIIDKYYLFKDTPHSGKLEKSSYDLYEVIGMILDKEFDANITLYGGVTTTFVKSLTKVENSFDVSDYRFPYTRFQNTVESELSPVVSVTAGLKYPIREKKTWFSYLNFELGFSLSNSFDSKFLYLKTRSVAESSPDQQYLFVGKFSDKVESGSELIFNGMFTATVYHIFKDLYIDAGVYGQFVDFEIITKTEREVSTLKSPDSRDFEEYTPTTTYSVSELKAFPVISLKWDFYKYAGVAFNYLVPDAQNLLLYVKYEM